jgi:hypothetical protein
MRKPISFKRIAKGLIVSYLIVLVALFFAQRSLLFQPRGNISPPASYGLINFDEVQLNTKDGLSIKAWYEKPIAAKKLVLFFMGNADKLNNYVDFFQRLEAADIAVLGVCYRGYCGNEGEPTEQGLNADGDAALEFARKDFADKDIIVMGRSLGSGVATNLAHKNSLGGLVLVSPYTSLPDVAAKIYWYVPVKLLMHDKFANIDKIAAVDAPVLIIHGDEDGLIPISHSVALNAKVQTQTQLKIYVGEGHNDVDFTRVAGDLIEFVGHERNYYGKQTSEPQNLQKIGIK